MAAVKPALCAAALAVGASVLRPDLLVPQLSRFVEDDRPPQAFNSTTLEVPGSGVVATETTPFLLVLTPADPQKPLNGQELSKFLDENTAWFRDLFFKYGAVLMRGFDVPDANAFEQVVMGITTELETAYLGTSPRSSINGTTYVHTAADFDQHRTLPVHIEMSFRDNPPKTQMFYASRVEHTKGGETPLTDFEGVWTTLAEDPQFKAKYTTKQLKYTRNYDNCTSLSKIDPLVQKCWQDMFKTSDREKVLAKCKEEQFECTFLDNWNGRLQISNVQPFIRPHPTNGRSVWFNHINVLTKYSMVYDYERTAVLWGGVEAWWPTVLALYFRTLFNCLSLVWNESDFGSSVSFADGTPITEEDQRAFKRAIWRNTFQAPYETHDIVIVDNMRVGHGREMYMGGKGQRMIMTAWSNNYPSKWMDAK